MHCDVLDSIGNEWSVVGGNQKQPENKATSDTQNMETISLCLTDTDASSTVDPRANTWLETVGRAEKEGADISPKKKEKKIFQLSNRLLAAA